VEKGEASGVRGSGRAEWLGESLKEWRGRIRKKGVNWDFPLESTPFIKTLRKNIKRVMNT